MVDAISIDELRAKSFRTDRVSKLIKKINKNLFDSYVKGNNWEFAYSSFDIEQLNSGEREELRKIYSEAGYEVDFSSGNRDEENLKISVSYDTRLNS